ncbi:MAG TPA: hypothetical protein V6D17_24430 [Candidatus Obscuribacterales bacterium]
MAALSRSAAVTAFIGFLAVVAFICWLGPLTPEVIKAPERASEIMPKGYIWRVPDIIRSKHGNELVMLGSSVLFIPNLLADGCFEGVQLPFFNIVDYAEFALKHVRAQHVETLLFGAGGKKPQVLDLSTPGAFASDYEMIIDKMIAVGWKPPLVVLALAPRDFIDNTMKTQDNLMRYELRRVLGISELVHAESLGTAAQLVNDWVAGNTATFLRDFRSDVRRIAMFIKKRGKRPSAPSHVVVEDIPGAVQMPTLRTDDKGRMQITRSQLEGFYRGHPFGEKNKLLDLNGYNNRYNPPNFKQFEQQAVCLDRLIGKATANGIKVVLVDMPLTEENRALLNPKLAQMYDELLSSSAQKYGLQLIRPQAHEQYSSTTEFCDCCHMNAFGFHKCFSYVASQLRANPSTARLLAALANKVN